MKFNVKHLGLIPDGGGRWAKTNNMSLEKGYMQSMDLIFQFSNLFFEDSPRTLSIYLFSIDNFKRERFEIDALMNTVEAFIKRLIDVQDRWNLNIIIAGQKNRLSPNVQAGLKKINNNSSRLNAINLCLAYDPMTELEEGFASYKLNPNSDLIEHLWVSSPVDLVLRTGGAVTLSKFLPLQTSHARLIFMEKMFNELSIEEIFEQISIHENMELSYGN